MTPRLIFATFVAAALLAWCATPGASQTPMTMRRIGFVNSNDSADGWTLQHLRARGDLDRLLTSLNIAIALETCNNCPTDPATFVAIVDGWANNGGLDMLFLTSGSHGPMAGLIRAKYPRMPIIVWGGPALDNYTIAPAQLGYQAYYLAGMACGFDTKTQHVGYVAPSTLTKNTYNQINAFLEGILSVNPTAQLHVMFSPSFYFPIAEYRTGQALIRTYNVDCAVGSVDTARAFVEQNRSVIGFNNDLQYALGDRALLSVLPTWSGVYADIVLGWYYNATLRNVVINGGIGRYVDISTYSPLLSPAARVAITATRAAMMNGTFNVFCNPATNARVGFPNVTSGCLTQSQIYKIGALASGGFASNAFNLSDADIYEDLYVNYDSGVAKALFFWASVGMICVVLSLAFVIYYRDTYVVRATSPLFIGVVIITGAFQIVSGFAWTGMPTSSVCLMRIWPFGLGFVIGLGTLFAKNYRIYSIFTNPSMEVVPFGNDLVALLILPFMAGIFILLGVWTGIDPYAPVHRFDNDLLSYQRYFTCGTRQSWGLASGLGYCGLVLVFAAIIAYLTRGKSLQRGYGNSSNKSGSGSGSPSPMHRLNHLNFVDSESIWRIALFTIITALFGIGVDIGVKSTVAFESAFNGLIQIALGTGLVLLVAGPKMWRVMWRGEKTSYAVKMQTTMTSGTAGMTTKEGQHSGARTGSSNKSRSTSSNEKTDSLDTENGDPV